MFARLMPVYEIISQHESVDDIYKAMENPDMAEVVMTMLSILKSTGKLPSGTSMEKSEGMSNIFRDVGNQSYRDGKYLKAMACYNKALLIAPKNSRAMKLAYSNRSALLLKLKMFSACINDIDTCFSLGCPHDILDKVKKRREEAQSNMWLENLKATATSMEYSGEFFKINKKNPQIPCASTDLGVIMENDVPKIVAVTDIKVGTVLAVETAFVSITGSGNLCYSCYYCHKMTPNLKPCDGCTFALFCSEDCREKCLKEYHSSECKISAMFDMNDDCSKYRLAIIAALKMRSSCKTWKEFATATQPTGISRIKTSSVNQIYDMNYPFSVLNFKDKRHFLHGPMYNAAFTCAAVIYYLEKVYCFFPGPADSKNVAQRAMARSLMFLSLYSTDTEIILSRSVHTKDQTEVHCKPNNGMFSLIGKLKNACNSNCLNVALNKKMALVALAPIKSGTELTIPYLGLWHNDDEEVITRQRIMFELHGVVCHCLICSGDYKLCHSELSETQRTMFRKMNLPAIREEFNCNRQNINSIFKKLCKMLSLLSDIPYSDEYRQVLVEFRMSILFFQDNASENVLVDYD